MQQTGPALLGTLLTFLFTVVAATVAGPAAGAAGAVGVLVAAKAGRLASVTAAILFSIVTAFALAASGGVGHATIAWVCILGAAALAHVPDEAGPQPESAPQPAPAPPTAPVAQATPAVLQALPDWILEVDREFNLISSNEPAGGIFPDVSDGDVGRAVDGLFDPALRSVVLDNLARSSNLNRPTAFEYYLRQGKKLHFAEMRIVPHGDRLWMISRDITRKRGREEALRESKERFALAAQGANDGLWDYNIQTDEVYYSHTFKSLLGEGASFGNNLEAWLSRVHPEDMRRVRHDLQNHLEGHSPRYESEHRIKDRDGDWLWVLSRGMAVRDSQGQAKRIAGSMTDLTNRRVVAATAEKSRLLEHATRAVGIGIAMRTRKHKLIDPSPMLIEMLRAWKDVATWWKAIQEPLELPPSIACPSCHAKQIVGSTRLNVQDPDGRARVFELTFTGHGHEVQHDQLVNVVLIEDVTISALAEERLHTMNSELVTARDEALASSRAKSAFLANMSHELRTPLNAILGYSEMLLEDAEDADSESAPDLRRIHGAGAHLLGLIAGILDLSKVEAGIMQVEIEEVDIAQVLSEVQATADPLRRENQFEVAITPLGSMRTDIVKLRQILLNLLGNAFKFTDGGTVSLTAELDDGQVVFQIADTGIGIDDTQLDTLFEEFVQGDLSSTKAFQGAGLGLALVKRFTELLGGGVDATSEVGVGTTFTVRLPLGLEAEADVETREHEVEATALLSP